MRVAELVATLSYAADLGLGQPLVETPARIAELVKEALAQAR